MIRYLLPVLGLLAAGLPNAVAEEQIKLPTLLEIERATKLVRDLFKEEYAQSQQAAKAALAAKLFAQVAETRDDPAAQFVLLRETAELAAAGNDHDLAVRACADLRARFSGPLSEVLEPILKTVVDRASAPDANQALTTYLLKLIDDAVAADDLDGAVRLHRMAEGTASRSKNVRTVSLVTARGRELEEFQKESAKVAEALKTLKARADDPDACLIAGKYHCFQKGDWARGLELLSKCSDPKLKTAAAKDLTEPMNPTEITQVADAWYEALGSVAGYSKRALQQRARNLYAKALPDLAGLSRTKAEKRLDELDKVLGATSDFGALWNLVRAGARNKTYDRIEPMGGAFGDKDYSEVLAEGGILIGFHYTLKKFFDKELIDCFQPIYLTPSGEKLGTAYGKFWGTKLTVKAKPNYAIGKMAIRGGGLWGGVNVKFMRIEAKGLNPNDTYETGWIGHKDHPDSPFLGDGRPIIGIHGKLQNEREGGGICSIGLFVVGEKGKEKR